MNMKYRRVPIIAGRLDLDYDHVREAIAQAKGTALVALADDAPERAGWTAITEADLITARAPIVASTAPAWKISLAAALARPETTQAEMIAKTLSIVKGLGERVKEGG